MTRWLALLVVALTGLVAPVASNVVVSTATDWRASPRFDGQAYLLSDEDVVPVPPDGSGVVSALVTLLRWRGDGTSTGAGANEATLLPLAPDDGGSYHLSDVAQLASTLGLAGRWFEADVAALAAVRTPFLASLREGGGHLIIVRRVAIGYVYAADPRRGNVLYPLETFREAWNGRLFVFDEPPPVPAVWR